MKDGIHKQGNTTFTVTNNGQSVNISDRFGSKDYNGTRSNIGNRIKNY